MHPSISRRPLSFIVHPRNSQRTARSLGGTAFVCLAFHFMLAPAFAQEDAADDKRPEVKVTDEALKVHNQTFVFDGHNDLPWQIRQKASLSFERLDISEPHPELHTDIERLRKGNVGAQFWSVYVPANTARSGTSLTMTLEQIELVHAMCKKYPDVFELALTYDDIVRIQKEGKIASLIGVEGGHSIEDSIQNLRRLYELGARYMTLTHSDTLAWADSATDDPQSDGLSPFGEEIVREMNRLGMLVDLSHVSPATMKDALATTKAPIIYSHSSARAIADHPRNVPDDVLKLVKENRGVVMINFFSGFIEPDSAKRSLRMFDVRREINEKYEDEGERRNAYARWQKENPLRPGSVHDVVDHIEHVIKVAGVDYVGIGSDYDGVGMLPKQLEDVSTYPVITQELLNRGYSAEDVDKIMSGNIMRVYQEAEKVSKELQSKQ